MKERFKVFWAHVRAFFYGLRFWTTEQIVTTKDKYGNTIGVAAVRPIPDKFLPGGVRLHVTKVFYREPMP